MSGRSHSDAAQVTDWWQDRATVMLYKSHGAESDSDAAQQFKDWWQEGATVMQYKSKTGGRKEPQYCNTSYRRVSGKSHSEATQVKD